MKLITMIVLPALCQLSVGLVASAPATASPSVLVTQDDGTVQMASGKVTKIDAANKTFNINTGAEGAQDVVITWNDATVFMKDGKVVKWDELVKEKASLTVSHKKGVASKVEGSTK